MNRSALVFLFILSFSNVFSQNPDPAPNELDKKYSPGQNSILNTDDEVQERIKSQTTIDYKNSVGFNPLLVLRGIAALNYERMIGDAVSVSLGIGSAFKSDIIMGSTSELSLLMSDPITDISVSTLAVTSTSSGAALYLSPAVRFYFDDSQDGSYLDLAVRLYKNPMKINAGYSEDNMISSSHRYHTIGSAGFNMVWGYQYMTSGSVSTLHDFYFGLGLKNISYDIYQRKEVQRTDGYGYTYYEYQTIKRGGRESIIAPSILFGYSFAIGF